MDSYYYQLTSFEYSFITKRRFGKFFDDQLETIVSKMIGNKIEDNTYLKLLQIYYYKYKFEKNIIGMRYCLLRMQQVNSYKKNRRQRIRYPNVIFYALYEENIKEFLLKQNSLYLDMVAQFIKEILFIDTFITVGFMTFLVVFCKMNFYLGFILSLLIFLMIYYNSIYNFTESRVDIRCSRLSKKVNKQLIELDVSLRR